MTYGGQCISKMHQAHCNCHKGAQNQGLAVHDGDIGTLIPTDVFGELTSLRPLSV